MPDKTPFGTGKLRVPDMRRSHVLAIRKEIIRICAKKTARMSTYLDWAKKVEKAGLKTKEVGKKFYLDYSYALEDFYKLVRIDMNRIGSLLRGWP